MCYCILKYLVNFSLFIAVNAKSEVVKKIFQAWGCADLVDKAFKSMQILGKSFSVSFSNVGEILSGKDSWDSWTKVF